MLKFDWETILAGLLVICLMSMPYYIARTNFASIMEECERGRDAGETISLQSCDPSVPPGSGLTIFWVLGVVSSLGIVTALAYKIRRLEERCSNKAS